MSLRDHEGYLLIDHRESPGVPDAIAVPSGLPAGAGRGVFEAPTFNCNHCQAIGVIDPSRRNGAAYFCRGCNRLLCDACGAEKVRTGKCVTFEQRVDQYLNSVMRSE